MLAEIATDSELCDGCDFVQLLVDGDLVVQVHHIFPDDDAGHVEDVDCPCGPDIERLDADLIVVDHLDQDPPPPFDE